MFSNSPNSDTNIMGFFLGGSLSLDVLSEDVLSF